MLPSAASTPPLRSVKIIGLARTSSLVVTRRLGSLDGIGRFVSTAGGRIGSEGKDGQSRLGRPPAILSGKVTQIERQNADRAEKHAAEGPARDLAVVEAGEIAHDEAAPARRRAGKLRCGTASNHRGFAHGSPRLRSPRVSGMTFSAAGLVSCGGSGTAAG